MRNWCLVLLGMMMALPAFSANFYVRKGASGANNGSDWNNAWNELNQINFSSVSCGDTVWLAGGSYSTTLTVNKACASGSVLNIKRVLSSDAVPVAAAGWNSSYDSQVVINDTDINVAGGAYYSIDGRQGAIDGSVPFGIQVALTGSGGGDAIDGAGSGSLSNVSFHYVELLGPPCVMTQTCGGGGASGLNIAPSSNKVATLLFDHGWIHRFGELVRTSNWSNCTIQYTGLSDTHNDGQQHEDVVYNYAQTNFTMRYNRIWGSPNDGIFFDFGGTNGFYFYGNVYYHSGGGIITFKPGYANATNIYIYNNIFENDGTFGDFQPGWLDFTGAANSGEVANNIFYNIDNNGTPPNANHNGYSISGTSDGGTGSFYYTAGTQFVNLSASNPVLADFHLTSTGTSVFAGKGKNLGAPYNIDADGNACSSAATSCNLGAYQTSNSATPPAAPTKLSAVVQ